MIKRYFWNKCNVSVFLWQKNRHISNKQDFPFELFPVSYKALINIDSNWLLVRYMKWFYHQYIAQFLTTKKEKLGNLPETSTVDAHDDSSRNQRTSVRRICQDSVLKEKVFNSKARSKPCRNPFCLSRYFYLD